MYQIFGKNKTDIRKLEKQCVLKIITYFFNCGVLFQLAQNINRVFEALNWL